MAMHRDDGDSLAFPGRIKSYRLEDILEAWLDTIRVGKVKAVGPETDSPKPWKLLPYSEHQINEAVEVFNKLVSAIEARMPQNETPPDGEPSPLFTAAALDAARIPPGFSHDFLTRARRPSFTFIAPGLSLPTISTIAEQPFSQFIDTMSPHHFRCYPVRLFESSQTYTRPKRRPNEIVENIFGVSFDLSSYPAGLYFDVLDHADNQHDDAVILVLPYAIGSNGFARKADGSHFGESFNDGEPNSRDVYDELYQTGRQPFIKHHHVRLVQVLKSWIGMVERGDWKVDAQGISNDINEWKNADTAGGWEKYVIPAEW